jgi:hypothetical protein
MSEDTYEADGETLQKIKVPKPEVLKAGVRHIEQHIKNWNQSDWIKVGSAYPDEQGTCGTTACLAGHILLSQGHSWRDLHEEAIPTEALNALGFNPNGEDGRYNFDHEIFCYTHDHSEGGDENVLAYTPQKLAAFKAWITTVTGVEFE